MIEKSKFIQSYKDESQRAKINEFWPDLEAIHHDYLSRKSTLTLAMNLVQESLRNTREVHSTRVRLKDPEHLIEKCVRKRLADPARIITPSTYMSEITDLVGVRALHLFKSDWKPIHRAITDTWDLKELPTANIRKGDSEKLIASYTEHGCTIKEHPFGYRSVHYLANTHPTKQSIVVEIQVRTLFEEAWSEIDHSVRYPYGSPPAIATFLEVFNRLAGSADEMGSFVQELQSVIRAMEVEHGQQVTELNKKIRSLENQINNSKINPTEKTEILHQVKAVSSAARSPSEVSWTNLFRVLLNFSTSDRPTLKPSQVPDQWLIVGPAPEPARQPSPQPAAAPKKPEAVPASTVKGSSAPIVQPTKESESRAVTMKSAEDPAAVIVKPTEEPESKTSTVTATKEPANATEMPAEVPVGTAAQSVEESTLSKPDLVTQRDPKQKKTASSKRRK